MINRLHSGQSKWRCGLLRIWLPIEQKISVWIGQNELVIACTWWALRVVEYLYTATVYICKKGPNIIWKLNLICFYGARKVPFSRSSQHRAIYANGASLVTVTARGGGGGGGPGRVSKMVILCFRTDRSGQTVLVQTQIRLLLKEQTAPEGTV